jgi:hypothetical protein
MDSRSHCKIEGSRPVINAYGMNMKAAETKRKVCTIWQ